LADLMMEREIVIGGEESGGIGYSRFLPERDGILNSLLLANVMAEERKPLGQLVADLQKEYGDHHYGRLDLHIPDSVKLGAIRRAASEDTKKLGNFAVSKKADLGRDQVFSSTPPPNGNGADAWVLFPGLRHRAAFANLYRSSLSRAGKRDPGPAPKAFVKASR
jgi:phosphoglucomutase